ncbi:hypothetical protein [Neobacillus terrae]|uniref:hypothetical protein n=1 Tax=Neobacillus terrae TaxID=3034837 RepID=UPI00140C04B3|nr:hypothetical protein [Neobacillus terrae]NHM31918.1 hypothetical protein [Neobacillus terrae]
MYFFKSIFDDVRIAQCTFQKYSITKRLVIGSFFSCMAAVLQSFGGFLPGIGYLISPLATAPILICSMFSFPIGAMAYLLTNALLFILQPSELLVFPFTTGLLGIGAGAAFLFFKKRLSIIAASGTALTLGIMILLYLFHFPVLGPVASDSFSINTAGSIFIFAFFYSLLWVEIGLFFFKKISAIIPS